MTSVWALAALWLGLALIASLLSIWFRISTALSEVVVGTIAQLIIGAVIGQAVLGTDESWVKFLSGIGAIVLTFLAGAELDPAVFKLKWKEAAAVGFASFFFPFLGCAAAAYYVLGWEPMPSWLAGVAMSTTSVAVVYAVMLEFGFNRTDYGKTVLAACFVTDLGTVVALGLIFAPFTFKTLVFLIVGAVVFFILPWLTPRFSSYMETGPRSSKPSSCCCACSEWERLRTGPTVRPCFQPISSAWCLRERSERTTRSSDGCVR
jgi:glutathione-regulated potassium-efflux system ancillary protein KefC